MFNLNQTENSDCKLSLTCITLKTIQQHIIFVLPHGFYCFFKINSYFNCDSCNTFKNKSWDSKAFKTWKCCHSKCNFVPFFPQTSLKMCSSMGSLLLHFAFQNAPYILYWAQVGTAGQSSTPTLFFCSHAFVMCAECGFPLSR